MVITSKTSMYSQSRGYWTYQKCKRNDASFYVLIIQLQEKEP